MKNVEYEATFYPVERDEMRQRLLDSGAELIREDFMQTRVCYDVPESCVWDQAFLRVRDEGEKITLALKGIHTSDGSSAIESQKEVEVQVDSFEKAEEFLMTLGFRKKSYQESRREMWQLDGVEVVIDEWPWIEPFVEVEGVSEEAVKVASEKLGFSWDQAIFGNVTLLYGKVYGASFADVNECPQFLFEGDNPFA